MVHFYYFSFSLSHCPPLDSPFPSRHSSALVPSPRPLTGVCFFPTRSSGILPFLTAAASPAPGRSRIHFWKTFLLSLPLLLFLLHSPSLPFPLFLPFFLSHTHHSLDFIITSSNIQKRRIQGVFGCQNRYSSSTLHFCNNFFYDIDN